MLKPYYEDSYCTIYHGDSREIIPQLDQKFDLLLTDPPYGTELLGGGYGRRQNHSVNGRDGRTIANDKDLSVATDGIQLALKLIETGYVGMFCAARRMFEAVDIVGKDRFLGEIIWDKGTPGLGYTVRYTHESLLLFKIGEPEKPETPLLSIYREQVNHQNTQERHPHEKPIGFWIPLVGMRAGAVLDPFMGSGTTLRAAKDLRKKAVGIELDERYCEISARRLQQEVLQF